MTTTPPHRTLFLHCKTCLEELPEGTSPGDYAQLEVVLLPNRLLIGCRRHNMPVSSFELVPGQTPTDHCVCAHCQGGKAEDDVSGPAVAAVPEDGVKSTIERAIVERLTHLRGGFASVRAQSGDDWAELLRFAASAIECAASRLLHGPKTNETAAVAAAMVLYACQEIYPPGDMALAAIGLREVCERYRAERDKK
jgi:hypothetical protein